MEPLLAVWQGSQTLLLTGLMVIGGLWLAHVLIMRRGLAMGRPRLARQVVMLALTAAGVIAVVLALPISESTRNSLLGLLGLVITGVIALSSTSFISNAMAGLMLRAVRSFSPGDFVRVGEYFGRVTERGLFHTEIQSEDRDLVTIPNLYLSLNPVTVIRSSGTIISCDLSLGYDVPYYRVEPLLKSAAEDAGLQDPFTQILTLGDFSITYRIAGFCTEVAQLLSQRTRLRRAVLDQMNGDGIEIVSPAFINQRRVPEGVNFTFAPRPAYDAQDSEQVPEKRIFDKADLADKGAAIKDEQLSLAREIEELKSRSRHTDGEEKMTLDKQIDARTKRLAHLTSLVDVASQDQE